MGEPGKQPKLIRVSPDGRYRLVVRRTGDYLDIERKAMGVDIWIPFDGWSFYRSFKPDAFGSEAAQIMLSMLVLLDPPASRWRSFVARPIHGAVMCIAITSGGSMRCCRSPSKAIPASAGSLIGKPRREAKWRPRMSANPAAVIGVLQEAKGPQSGDVFTVRFPFVRVAVDLAEMDEEGASYSRVSSWKRPVRGPRSQSGRWRRVDETHRRLGSQAGPLSNARVLHAEIHHA